MPDVIILDVCFYDVLDGTRGSSCYCPVALALRRQFPRGKWFVGYEYAANEEYGRFWYRFNEGEAISAYDDGAPLDLRRLVLVSETAPQRGLTRAIR